MILESLKLVNVILRFLLELIGLTVYGYWGYKLGTTAIMRWGLAAGIPFMIAVVWGLFGSPKATFQLSGLSHLLLEACIFLVPAVLLINLGKVQLAWFYGIIVIVNRILMYVWEQ
ncbi:YrdB family protein [Bacillus sp. DTU_2020_1000418_1_SI_GHA_SEK_038]|uniref:YrdB family protein n=1 Tax=Bacillus sp. DTU_2020_1000418_1_SI_GHA_SEK_038 TaxID=3077585 RepID=UPI0028E2481C|nr:YrdB family protein [Bacillus sp. DTU_2020_1000418_1_SI_GHA_SEK_038]WNS75776.1 YrdB family protein [Bacillus sp. DTU_2020_1000418_1_SI_GHA_SEK_038]